MAGSNSEGLLNHGVKNIHFYIITSTGEVTEVSKKINK
jgi:hypothetical protein